MEFKPIEPADRGPENYIELKIPLYAKIWACIKILYMRFKYRKYGPKRNYPGMHLYPKIEIHITDHPTKGGIQMGYCDGCSAGCMDTCYTSCDDSCGGGCGTSCSVTCTSTCTGSCDDECDDE